MLVCVSFCLIWVVRLRVRCVGSVGMVSCLLISFVWMCCVCGFMWICLIGVLRCVWVRVWCVFGLM